MPIKGTINDNRLTQEAYKRDYKRYDKRVKETIKNKYKRYAYNMPIKETIKTYTRGL